ncbi:MAG TPA: serine hydrolase [Steroidobacteraceae bacterium]|nr:serine hydrolase [Steroidobacteraceae bacterium]
MKRRVTSACLLCAFALAAATQAGAAPSVDESTIDALFSEWTQDTPGCAVGVAENGRILLEKAYGLADLEHGVPNRPDTIFEAGSVSKQFTAAAVLLLARDGKLALDDPVRKHIPELPDYAAPVTIRQMLHHTSGLRDWGSIEWIAGWPRGTRVYTHAHVLDILARQQRLNFPPGTHWSYSNSGYNLAVILASRVAGESFAEFTRKQIFEPLGMTRTSWRDDYTRIVKDRAIAYAATGGRYAQDMPFENVHGNGGLLTTVGDLLRWNANFESLKVGEAEFLRQMQTSGVLGTGGETGYGFGLAVGRYKGLSEIRHSGTTASYRAYLARYPEQRLSVALLCNAGDSMPRQTVHAVADLYLADVLKPEPPPTPARLSSAELERLVGLYRNDVRGDTFRIEREGDALRLGDGTALVAYSQQRLTDGEGFFIEVDHSGSGNMDDGRGENIPIRRVAQAYPTAEELAQCAGEYRSDEAETTLGVRVRDGALELTQRPDRVYPLTPLYHDAFESELGTIIFRRNGDRVTELSVVEDRVWDLRLRRVTESGETKRVLIFGDSNTWGWIPVERGYPTTRYPADQRWPGVAQAALGVEYQIIEEGLNGRTTDLPDPSVRGLPGAGLDGSAYLPATVASHLPVDLLVIMLGTNDLQTSFDRSPEEVAQGMNKLVRLVKALDRGAWTEYPAPRVLVIAPPPMTETERFPAEVFANGVEKSRQLAARYETVARDAGAEFLDAGALTQADGVDGLHLSADAHRKIGLAIADRIRVILE